MKMRIIFTASKRWVRRVGVLSPPEDGRPAPHKAQPARDGHDERLCHAWSKSRIPFTWRARPSVRAGATETRVTKTAGGTEPAGATALPPTAGRSWHAATRRAPPILSGHTAECGQTTDLRRDGHGEDRREEREREWREGREGAEGREGRKKVRPVKNEEAERHRRSTRVRSRENPSRGRATEPAAIV